MPEFPNLIHFAIPFFIIAMLLELYVTTKENIKTYEKNDAFSGKKALKHRLLYLVKPPGWRHDGTGKVSDDLRKEWKSKSIQ